MMDRSESPSRMSQMSDRSMEQPMKFKPGQSETLSCMSGASGCSEERQKMESVNLKIKKAERAESVLSNRSEGRLINFRRTKSRDAISLPSVTDSGLGSIETGPSWDLTSNIIPREHRQRSADAPCDFCQESKLKADVLLLENDDLKKMIKDMQSENLNLKKQYEALKQTVEELKLPDYIRRGKTPVAENLTLNPDTAHGALLLSKDGKRVRLGDWITVHQSAQRFDKFECVLAREGFSSGRHYWEVELNREFTIGVTCQSAQRKGKFTFCPSEGYWCLYHFGHVFTALEDSTYRLQVDSVPRVLGVCIDVDEKWVVFYNTETKTRVYTFRNMAFTDGEKIYPMFNTLEKSVDLVIRTVR